MQEAEFYITPRSRDAIANEVLVKFPEDNKASTSTPQHQQAQQQHESSADNIKVGRGKHKKSIFSS